MMNGFLGGRLHLHAEGYRNGMFDITKLSDKDFSTFVDVWAKREWDYAINIMSEKEREETFALIEELANNEE